jgi:FlaA1/EpsC-like NDP-sugar epimerase
LSKKVERIVIIGAGDASKRFVQTIQSSKELLSKYHLAYIFDDNLSKVNSKFCGIKVVDVIKNLANYSKDFDTIIIAIPSTGRDQFNVIYNYCVNSGKKILTVPSLKEILYHSEPITSVRDINIKDLINREEIEINYKKISKIAHDKTILITGGAGSIGSMILKLCLSGKAKKIICIDNSEYNTYKLLNSINDKRLISKVSDIRDKKMMNLYFSKYKPDIVFHAAALKHVNLQEDNIRECLLTNFFGTQNILSIANKYSVDNFVLISTDKAVEPSNNMGLSKRMAELLVSYYSNSSKTKMSIVRFGNVIGSSGSVLVHFSKLIKNREDITVTHPQVKRYFMSIEEACYLVINSINEVKNNYQVFMLDMGEEILINEIAKTLIKINGLELGRDININYSKLSTGEKISEKLNYSFEEKKVLDNNKIIRLDSSKAINSQTFGSFISELHKIIYKDDQTSNKSIVAHLKKYFKELI